MQRLANNDESLVTLNLDSSRIGAQLEYLKATTSTNADAFRLAEDGAIEGTVVLADSQTGGKGRRGRIWSSPAGIDNNPAVNMNAPLIIPTCDGSAPSEAAYRGMTGMRRYELNKAMKPIRQIERNGEIEI